MQDTGPRGDASAADKRMFEDICGDFGLFIRRDGTWFYRGSPIGRKPLVKLFASVLRRDDAGDYWLITPAEKGRIEVEDVPFLAVEASIAGTGREQTVTLRTNLDEIVTVGREHPLRVASDPMTGAPAPYVLVRDRLEARLARPVFYELVERGEESVEDGRRILGVWSGGAFFRLGAIDGEVAPAEGAGP
ncbi:MAG: DUF1285 domain-containing protein [Bauldia sp.]|nr:MAG: DUF1285 domain-containing protein [Bauldia sp.]